MDEKIIEQLKLLNRYVLYLKEISTYPKEKFLKDFLLIGGTERYLQLAIETCINIGNRLLSLIQFKKPVSFPNTYRDIFLKLEKIGIIPENFTNTMIKMVKFRYRLVHMYWEIEPEYLYDIITNDLKDFEKFIEYIIDYIKKRKFSGDHISPLKNHFTFLNIAIHLSFP